MSERFEIQQSPIGSFAVVDTYYNNEPIFGDNGPRDKKEAEQCLRAARIAESLTKNRLLNLLNQFTVSFVKGGKP